MSEISDVRDGTHDSPSYLSEGHPFVTSKNVKDGYINYDDIQYISDDDFEAINKRSKVDVNDILMGMIGTIGNLALIRTEPDFAIKNVALIKDTKQVSYMYLYHYLQSPNIERQLLSGLDGGTQKFVSLKNIRELDIMVPSEAEQIKVGTFIESLDNLIILHQRQYYYLCINQKVWEQRKLGEVAEYRNGKAHENEIDSDGKYIVVNSKFVSTDGEVKKFSNAQNEPLFENEIAFVLSDVPNGRAIARTFLVDKSDKYTLNQRIAGITPHANTDPYYLHIRMNRNAYFLKFDDGNKQTNLSINDVMNYEDMYPSYDEQKKVGTYFKNLDNLITLHRRMFHTKERRTYR